MKFSTPIPKSNKLNIERFIDDNNKSKTDQYLTSVLNVKLIFKGEFFIKLPIHFSVKNSIISGKVNEFKIILISLIISILIFLVFVFTDRIGVFSLCLCILLGAIVYLDLRIQLKKALFNFINSLLM